MTAALSAGFAPQLALSAALVLVLLGGAARVASASWLRLAAAAALVMAAALLGGAWPGFQGPILKIDGLALGWQYLFYLGAVPMALLMPVDDEVPVALFLGSVIGMALLASSGSLLMLFIGLEFMSLPAYLLVARGRRDRDGYEAAMKYFFAGGTAGALFLLGMALYYSQARTLSFSSASGPASEAGLALMGAAALFKIGAFPLHFWLPDVYESSRPELAGFLSTSMKSAAVLLLMRVAALAPHAALARALPAVGAVTALFGALVALRQRRLQRLLAYSSISHAGNLILGVGAWAAQGALPGSAAAVYFYLVAYLFTSNGAFLFLRASGLSDRAQVAGLSRRSPALAALFAALMLSLGGIPPTAGFLGKLLVFWEAIKAGALLPAFVAGIAALVGLGYYLGLVRDMYLEEPADVAAQPAAEPFDRITLAACALPASVLGLAPWLVGTFSRLLSP